MNAETVPPEVEQLASVTDKSTIHGQNTDEMDKLEANTTQMDITKKVLGLTPGIESGLPASQNEQNSSDYYFELKEAKGFDLRVEGNIPKRVKRDPANEQDRKTIIREAERGYGFLQETDPFRMQLQEHIQRLFPEKQLKIEVVLDPEIQAFTWEQENQVFVNAGLINEMAQFFLTQGKSLSYEHVLFILGHEAKHHSEKSDTTHLAELNCDIESAKAMARVGFNPGVAIDAMEFLRYVNNSSFSFSHPGSDFRLTELKKMLSDPNYYLPNRSTALHEVDTKTLRQLETSQEKVKRSLEIWRETDTEKLLQSLQGETDPSAGLETVERITDLMEVEIAQNILNQKDSRLDKLTLFYATLASLTTEQFISLPTGATYNHIGLENFQLIQLPSRLPTLSSETANETLVALENQAREQLKKICEEPESSGYRSDIVQKSDFLGAILDGKFTDPTSILTGRSPVAQVFFDQGVDFNKFFNTVSRRIEKASYQSIQDQSTEKNQRPPKYHLQANIPEYDYWRAGNLIRRDGQLINQEDVAQAREHILVQGLPAWTAELVRQSFEDRAFLETNTLEHINIATSSIKERVRQNFARILGSRLSTTTDKIKAILTRAVLGETLIGERGVNPEEVIVLTDTDKESLEKALTHLRFYPIHGGNEYSSIYEINKKVGGMESEVNERLSALYAPLLKFTKLSDLAGFLVGDAEPFVAGKDISDIFGEAFVQKFSQEQSIDEVRKILEATQYDPGIFSLLLRNPSFAHEIKVGLVIEGLRSGKIGSTEVGEIVTYAFKNSGEPLSLSEENRGEFLRWCGELLPSHYIESQYALEHYTSPYKNLWETIQQKYEGQPLDVKMAALFKMGGIILPYEKSDLDNETEGRRQKYYVRLTKEQMLELKNLDPARIDNLARILRHYIDLQQERFSYDLREKLNNFAYTVSYIKTLQMAGGDVGALPETLDINIPFEQFMTEVSKKTPPCRKRDLLLNHAIEAYGLTENAEIIEKVLPFLTPIEKPGQTIGESAIENAGYNTIKIPTEKDADPYDLFNNTNVKWTVKTLLVESLIKHQSSFWEGEASYTEKLARLDSLIPKNCKYKDVYLQRIFRARLNQVEALPSTKEGNTAKRELADQLKERLGNVMDAQLRVTLGYMGIRIEQSIQPEMFQDFTKGMELITLYMPDYSYRRDGLLVDLVNTTVTTPEQIFETLELMLSNNYRSDRPDISVARGGSEIEGVYLRKRLNQAERGEFFLWLLNPSKTPSTVDETRGVVTGSYLVTDKMTLRETRDIDYLFYLRAMNSGLPKPLAQDLESKRSHIVSLREKFLFMNEFERRELLFDLLVGEKGVFSPDNTPESADTMRTFLDNFGDVMLKDVGDMNPEAKQMVKDILTETFTNLSSASKANTFLHLVDIFSQNQGKVESGPAVIKQSLEAFGVVGVKLGQILSEQSGLLPENYKEALRNLKDSVRALPKTFAVQIMESEGITGSYQTLGRLLGSASVKQVYEADNLVGKFRRPHAEETVQENFRAVYKVLEMLGSKYPKVKIPRDLVRRLDELIIHEVNFSNEAANVELMRSLGQRTREGFTVEIPEIRHIGSDSIFEERASGLPLAEILRIKNGKLPKDTNLTQEQLAFYKGLDETRLNRAVAEEFLWEVFNREKEPQNYYHADLHAGNVHFSPDMKMSMIDWGMTGIISNPGMQRDFFRVFLGMGIGDYEMVGGVIRNYSSDAPENIQQVLQEQTTGKTKTEALQKVLETIGRYNPSPQLVTFIKSLISAQPYFEALPNEQVQKLVRPYVAQSIRNPLELMRLLTNFRKTIP